MGSLVESVAGLSHETRTMSPSHQQEWSRGKGRALQGAEVSPCQTDGHHNDGRDLRDARGELGRLAKLRQEP